MAIYEVKKNGVTIEWSDSFREAEEAFKDASNGECFFYKIVDSKKVLLRKK